MGAGNFFTSIWGGITGSSSVYGKKPVIPAFPTSEEVLKEGTAANLAAFPSAEQLASRTTEANQAILSKAWESIIPGYSGMVGQISKNLSAQLRGEIPPDVAGQVSRRAVARSLAGGFGGSGMGRNLEARDLGLTSYAITNQGLDSAQRWLGFSRAARMAEPMSVQSMFFTPAQQAAMSEGRFQRDLLQAKVKAAPDPGAAGAFNSFMELIGLALSAYGGGSGWKGTGSSGGGGGAAPPTYNYYGSGMSPNAQAGTAAGVGALGGV